MRNKWLRVDDVNDYCRWSTAMPRIVIYTHGKCANGARVYRWQHINDASGVIIYQYHRCTGVRDTNLWSVNKICSNSMFATHTAYIACRLRWNVIRFRCVCANRSVCGACSTSHQSKIGKYMYREFRPCVSPIPRKRSITNQNDTIYLVLARINSSNEMVLHFTWARHKHTNTHIHARTYAGTANERFCKSESSIHERVAAFKRHRFDDKSALDESAEHDGNVT